MYGIIYMPRRSEPRALCYFYSQVPSEYHLHIRRWAKRPPLQRTCVLAERLGNDGTVMEGALLCRFVMS